LRIEVLDCHETEIQEEEEKIVQQNNTRTQEDNSGDTGIESLDIYESSKNED